MSLFQNIRLILVSGAGSVFNVIISIIRVKVVALVLGTNGIAVFGQLSNLTNISALLSHFGMPVGLVTEVSKERSKRNESKLRQLKTTYSCIVLVASLLASIFIYFFSGYINEIIFNDAKYERLIELVAVNTSFLGVALITPTILKADKKIKLLTLFTIFSSFINGLLTILLVLIYDLEGILYGMVIGNFIVIIFGFLLLKRDQPFFMLQIKSLTFESFRSKFKVLSSYGLVSLGTSILLQLSNLGLKSLIIYKSSVHSAGLFQAAVSISNQYLPIVLTSLGAYLLPQLAENAGKRLNSEANNSLRAVLIMFIPVLILISLFSSFFMSLLYSDQFIEASMILSIILISDVLKITNRVLGTLIIAVKDFRAWIIGDLLAALFPLLSTLVLFEFFDVLAAPIAILFAYVLLFIFYALLLNIIHGIRLENKTLFLITSSIVLLGLIIILTSYYSVVIALIVVLPLTVIILYLSLSSIEIRLIKDVFKHIF